MLALLGLRCRNFATHSNLLGAILGKQNHTFFTSFILQRPIQQVSGILESMTTFKLFGLLKTVKGKRRKWVRVIEIRSRAHKLTSFEKHVELKPFEISTTLSGWTFKPTSLDCRQAQQLKVVWQQNLLERNALVCFPCSTSFYNHSIWWTKPPAWDVKDL